MVQESFIKPLHLGRRLPRLYGAWRHQEAVPCPLDANGKFTNEVPDFVGQHVKAADEDICAKLKASGRLIKKSAVKHSYPFC